MKKTALTMAISSVLLAGGAQAATVYDQNDTKLEIGGRAQGMYYGTDNNGSEGDKSYLRLHIAGETKIDNELTAFGFAEYNLPVSGSDNDELRYAFAGIKHDRFGAFSYGRQDGLFTKAVNNYTDVLPEWGGDGLGKDTEVFGTGRTNGLAQYIYTYQGLTLGAQFTGNNDPQNAGRSEMTGPNSTWNSEGSAEGFALSANYDFDMGLSLGAAYNQAGKTDEQADNAAFGGDRDAKLYGVGAKYAVGDLYLAATYSHGEDHLFVNNGYAEKMDGYEAVAQYTFGKFKPSLAYLRTDVKDNARGIDDTATEYVSIGAWYNFTDNFNAYVDYKINLLDNVNGTHTNSLGKNTDDVVAVALQYNF
ncbi:porin [Aeromonas sp. 2HA2]|nr:MULTISPECIES: porin [Aeromonas]ELI6431624.1 porin [Aeromonas salmonicida subsp. salmonicida]MDF2410624.1 porin [Aeromonas sp. 2HA2]MDM5062974.1 porin [Aeromonas salmonicida]MDM5101366.1 porin [Aeromonas salmonicida]